MYFKSLKITNGLSKISFDKCIGQLQSNKVRTFLCFNYFDSPDGFLHINFQHTSCKRNSYRTTFKTPLKNQNKRFSTQRYVINPKEIMDSSNFTLKQTVVSQNQLVDNDTNSFKGYSESNTEFKNKKIISVLNLNKRQHLVIYFDGTICTERKR